MRRGGQRVAPRALNVARTQHLIHTHIAWHPRAVSLAAAPQKLLPAVLPLALRAGRALCVGDEACTHAHAVGRSTRTLCRAAGEIYLSKTVPCAAAPRAHATRGTQRTHPRPRHNNAMHIMHSVIPFTCGVRVRGGTRAFSISYAGDIVLVAETAEGMRCFMQRSGTRGAACIISSHPTSATSCVTSCGVCTGAGPCGELN